MCLKDKFSRWCHKTKHKSQPGFINPKTHQFSHFNISEIRVHLMLNDVPYFNWQLFLSGTKDHGVFYYGYVGQVRKHASPIESDSEGL